MSDLQLSIESPEVNHKGKVVLIQKFLGRCSGKVTVYGLSISGAKLTVTPNFKSQEALERVNAGITDILEDMCERLDDQGAGCCDHYNCCDCGGNNCGCAYCFTCNACQECLSK